MAHTGRSLELYALVYTVGLRWPPAMMEEKRKYQGTRSLEDSRINRNGLPVGTPAPSFRLPTLDGSELSLEDYRGHQVLLVFSDPTCGPCNELLPHLRELHHQVTDFQILMVSRGDREANRGKISEFGLEFPVVLQLQWEISRDYGMFATPIAYRIDRQGIIAADVAVGVEAILALATGRERPAPALTPEAALHAQLLTRLEGLRQEFEKGQGELRRLEAQQTYVRETMLRISGAIQVLEEVLAPSPPPEQNSARPSATLPTSTQTNSVHAS